MAKKFLTDINIAGGVYDSSGDIGNSGQVLSSTGSGVNWINATSSASIIYQDGFTGDGSTTAFTLANSLDNENKTQVYIDGVYQHKDNYSLSGTTLTFSTAPPNSSDIEVMSFSSVSAADDILYDDDFTSAGLMTTNGSGVYSITTNNSSNWNTAYGWGDHSTQGYITDGNTNWNNSYGFITASSTDTLTNKSGNVSMFTNDSGYITDGNTNWNNSYGFITSSSTETLTNKSGNISMFTNDSNYATQSYVNTQVSNLVDSAPSTLDTLNELAAALGDDANFSTTVTNSIATKLPLAGGTITGDLEVNSILYNRSTLRVLNAAGTGWHDWATRGGGKYDLNVNNITVAAITASGNVTASSGTGHFSVVNSSAYQLNGTYVMDSSRNLVNIANITASGNVTVTGNVASLDTFYLQNGSGKRWQMLFDTNDFNLRYYNGSSWSADALAIDTSNNATFAGNLMLLSGTSGTTDKLIFKRTDNASEASFIRTNAYWNEYGAHTNEGHKFIDSSGNILLQLNGGNSTTGNGSLSATFAGNVTTGALQAQSWLFRSMSGQVEYHVLNNGNINGPSWKFRYDGATANRWVDFGYKDGNGTYYEGLKLYNNSTITWKGNTMWHAGNDGSGSGLDADLLDGVQGSGYYRYYETTAISSYDSLTAGAWSTNSTSATNIPYGNYNATWHISDTASDRQYQIWMGDTSAGGLRFRAKQGSSTGWHGWEKVWTDVNDGPGSGLNADLLDGIGGDGYLRSNAADTLSAAITLDNNGYFVGSPTHGFRFNNSGDTINALIVDNSGNSIAYASHRAPIFYDSNNTAYFYHGDSSASLAGQMNIHGGTSGSYGNQLVVGQSSINLPYTLQDTNQRPIIAATGAYPVLHLNHTVTSNSAHGPTIQFTHNGNAGRQWLIGSSGDGEHLFIGFSNTSQGNSSWNPHNGISGYSGTSPMTFHENGRVGIGGDWGVYGSGDPGYAIDTRGTLYNNTDVRAPIFYDSNNTGFYAHLDNSGVNTSINAAGVIRGNWFVASNYTSTGYTVYKGYDNWNHFISIRGHARPGQSKAQAAILGGHQTSFVEYAENNSTTGWFFIGSAGSTYEEIAKITKDFALFTQVRAPIFYDSNNTNYYTDPASTSVLNALQFNYTQHGSANNIRMGNSTTMNAISSGTNNAAFGVEALGNCTTGSRNFAYGYAALYSVSSGSNNIAMGDAAGYNVSSGGNNLLFGINSGRTGFQSPQSIAGVTTGSNQIHMGNESHTTARIQISWTVNSDQRDKTDITPINVGLDFVNKLNPVTFRWDKRSDYEDRTPTGENKLEELTLGFLAQEVEEVEKSYGYDVSTKTNLVVDRDVEQDHFGITYEKMIPILTKAIQELKAEVETLKNQINGIN